jgi:hypothetical protein
MTQVLPTFLLKNQRPTPPMAAVEQPSSPEAADQMKKPVAVKQVNAILQSQQLPLPAQLGESSSECAVGTLTPSKRRLP